MSDDLTGKSFSNKKILSFVIGYVSHPLARKLYALLFTVGSFVLLYYTIQKSGVRWHHLRLSFIQWFYFLLAMLMVVVAIWLQSVRVIIPWEKHFHPRKPDSINGLYLCFLYNCMLPGNLGEGIRAWHFSKKNGTSFSQSLAAIALEKYIDAFNFLGYSVLLAMMFWDFEIYRFLFLPTSLLVAGIFLLYILIIKNPRVEKFCLNWLTYFGQSGKWLWNLHVHIKELLLGMNKKQLARYALLGFFIFALNIIQYFFILKVALVPEGLLTWSVAFMVSVSMVFVFLIPSAPGNTGVVHYGIFSLLTSLAAYKGISLNSTQNASLAVYTIYLHLSYILPEVVIGSWVLIKEKGVLFGLNKMK